MQTLEQVQSRLTKCYFSQQERQIQLKPGSILREQDDFNDRLYYVLKGRLIGTIRHENEDGEEEQVIMFYANQGSYIGMHSFFSNDEGRASSRVTAETDTLLAWIDEQTQPVEPERYGSISEQFMRVIIEELFCRQTQLCKMTTAREIVVKQLYEAERLSVLGELSAGVTHELNNAISVINSSSARLSELFTRLLQQYEPDLVNWFNRGRTEGQQVASYDVRQRYRQLRDKFAISDAQAKMLARAIDPETLTALPEKLDDALMLWDAGRDFHDMLLAARHASNIVRSVKQLAKGDVKDQGFVDINQTINEALTLLQSRLRGISVTLTLQAIPPIWGSPTELVQIWVNIIKNACDALASATTPPAEIIIVSGIKHNFLQVSIANNGPPIPQECQSKIFLPKFTTKNDLNSIGLGLGLSIVQRIVSSYNGRIRVQSKPEQTIFYVVLPLTTAPSC